MLGVYWSLLLPSRFLTILMVAVFFIERLDELASAPLVSLVDFVRMAVVKELPKILELGVFSTYDLLGLRIFRSVSVSGLPSTLISSEPYVLSFYLKNCCCYN